MTGCHGALQKRVVLSNLGWRFPPSRGHRGRQGFCFVLETIRTGAMRVIHITVKTDETQKLRIKFVLVLSYLNSNTTSVIRSMILIRNESAIPSVNKSTHLAAGRHHRLVTLAINRTTIPSVYKCTLLATGHLIVVLRSTQIKSKRNSISHLSVQGNC